MENLKPISSGFAVSVAPEESSKSLIILTEDSLEHFKKSVDNLLSKRAYFISQVLPKLKDNQDYYVIKGRKSLAKGGAEKLASIYNFIAEFRQDVETTDMLKSVPGLVAFVCNLVGKGGQLAGQGRGSSTLAKNQGDANKTIKIAQKSAFIDAVIRSTGLSDLFTQDIEDMSMSNTEPEIYEPFAKEEPEEIEEEAEVDNGEMNKSYFDKMFAEQETPIADSTLATDKQINLIIKLAESKCHSELDRSYYLKGVESGLLSKATASQYIGQLLQMAR